MGFMLLIEGLVLLLLGLLIEVVSVFASSDLFGELAVVISRKMMHQVPSFMAIVYKRSLDKKKSPSKLLPSPHRGRVRSSTAVMMYYAAVAVVRMSILVIVDSEI